MDKPQALLVACCASLARLLLRIQHQLVSHEQRADGTVNIYPAWQLRHLVPRSSWLEDMNPNTALSGAQRTVALVLAHLTAMLDNPAPIDRLRACVVLQALGASGWSTPVLRLAAQLEVTLPATPMNASHGVALSEASIPVRPAGAKP